MYCRFPKGYFFEVEKIENLLEFEEMEEMRGVEEEDLDVSKIDIFEFDSTDDDDDERNKCKCNKKKEEHIEHKCEKHTDKVKEDDECGCKKEKSKNKCKEEGKFFTIADEEYVEEIKVKIHDCKCNCKK
ncbi:MAG: hypothetical protein ACRC30_08900 [Clostridium sp.]